jgi:ADP-heptose:LPS heptosyltransferase
MKSLRLLKNFGQKSIHWSALMKQVIKRIEYGLKVLLYKGIFQMLFRNKPFTTTLDAQQVERILILRRDMFGDMVITTALFKAIQDLNPNIKLDVIASQKGEQVIRHNPRLSSIWIHDKSLLGFWKMILEARKYRYDAVICLSISGLTKDGLIANLIARTAPKFTIRQPKPHSLYQILFNKEVEANHLKEPLWLSQKRVLDALFGVEYPEENLTQELYPSPAAEKRVEEFLSQNRLEKKKYVVVNLSARLWYRRWGRANFVAYLREMIYRYADLKFVITATPDEHELVWGIMDDVRDEHLFRIPNEFGLEEIMLLTKHALLLVSPDTANVHIAATYKTPSVILCTPLSSNVMWIPLHNRHISIYTPTPEPITSITPEQVIQASETLLREIGIEPKPFEPNAPIDDTLRLPHALSGLNDAKHSRKSTRLRHTIQHVRSAVYRWLFGNTPTTRKLNPHKVKRVLIVRNDVLGDMIVSTPIFNAIKAINPAIEIDVVASPQNVSIIENDSRLSHIIIYENTWRFWFNLWKLGRKRRYDVVLSLIFGTPQTQGFIANIASSRETLKLSVQRQAKYECFFSRTVRVPQEAHISEQWLCVALDAFELNGQSPSCHITLELHSQPLVEAFLKEKGIDEKKFIVINLSAGKNAVKRWTQAKYGELIDWLSEKLPYSVVLSCAPNEVELMDELACGRNAVCFYPTSDVRDVADLIRRATLLITPDTGVVHLASATKTPVIALYSRWVGGEVHRIWTPYQTPHKILIAPRRLPVSFIEVAEVKHAILSLLSELNLNTQHRTTLAQS